MKATIKSGFHGSEAKLLGKWQLTGQEYQGRREEQMMLTGSQVRRANRRLCGISDCACGGIHRLASEGGEAMRFEELSQDGAGRLTRWVRHE